MTGAGMTLERRAYQVTDGGTREGRFERFRRDPDRIAVHLTSRWSVAEARPELGRRLERGASQEAGARP
jgi:hypothetical protein